MEDGVAWFVLLYFQVYKYRRFRTVRQNTSSWLDIAEERVRSAVGFMCVYQAVVGEEKYRGRKRWIELACGEVMLGYRDVAATECVTVDIN